MYTASNGTSPASCMENTNGNTQTIKQAGQTKGQNIRKIESSVKVCHSFYSEE